MSLSRRALSTRKALFARRQQQSPPRRRNFGQAERLELRAMMAADFAPYHNYWYAQDVNNDYVATPLDALIIINELNAAGPRMLDAPGESGSEGEDGVPNLIDVNGDGALTPMDALDVINHLNAEGTGPNIATYQTVLVDKNGIEFPFTTDVNGAKHYSVPKDARVGVSVSVKDERPVGPANSGFYNAAIGIFSSYVDVFFDQTKLDFGFSDQQRLTLAAPSNGNTAFFTLTVDLGDGTGPYTTNEIEIEAPSNDVDRSAIARLIDRRLEEGLRTTLGLTTSTNRFTVASVPSTNNYLVSFRGDVDRDIQTLITVNNVTGKQALTTKSVVEIKDFRAYSTDNRADMDVGLNLSEFYNKTVADTATLLNDYFPGVLARVGALASQNYQTSANLSLRETKATIDASATDNKTTVYSWTQSPSNPNEYYARAVTFNASGQVTGEVNPNFTSVSIVAQDFVNLPQDGTPEDGLAAGEWDFTDKDSLGFNTIYVSLATGVDPDTLALGALTYREASPTAYEPPRFIELFTPYFTATDGTSGAEIQVALDWPGYNTGDLPLSNDAQDDLQTNGITTLLLNGNSEGFSGVVPRSLIDLGKQVFISIQADVTAVDDTFSRAEGSTTALDVLGGATPDTNNVSGGSQSDLRVIGFRAAGSGGAFATTYDTANGTVTLNGSSVEFTAKGDFYGTFSFEYALTNLPTGSEVKDIGLATVTVTNANDAPAAVNDARTVAEDSDTVFNGTGAAANADVTLNDSVGPSGSTFPDTGDTLTVTAVTQGTLGTVSIQGGKVRYQANSNASGTDTFTYTVTDSGSLTSTATVTMTITPVNDPPSFTIAATTHTVAEDAAAQTAAGFVTNINPGPANSVPQETGSVTFTLTEVNRSTTLTFTSAPQIASNGTLTYAATGNAYGTAQYDVVATDGTATSAPTRITIQVTADNDNPTFVATTLTTAEDVSRDIDLGTLVNDNETIDASLTYAVSAVVGGTMTKKEITPGVFSNQVYIFTPTGDFNGTASFTLTVTDIGQAPDDPTANTVNSNFNITVTPVNDKPDAVNDAIEVPDSSIAFTLDILANDKVDPDTAPPDDLRITSFTIDPSTPLPSGLTLASIRIAADGKSMLIDTPSTLLAGTLKINYVLRDRAVVTDSEVQTDTAQATLTFVPSKLPRAIDDVYTFTETAFGTGSQTLSVLGGATPDVAYENAANIKITGISLTEVESTAQTVTIGGVTISIDQNDFRSLIVNSTDPDFFTATGSPLRVYYTINEDFTPPVPPPTRLPQPDVGTVSINVTNVNDAPSFDISTAAQTQLDALVEDNGGSGPVSVNLITNVNPGPSESAQVLTYTVTSDNSSLFKPGTLQVSSAGVLTFELAADQEGTATLEIVGNDGGGTADGGVATFTRTVIISVAGDNDAPQFQTVVLTTPEDVALDINFGTLVNDVETADSALTFAVSNVVGGTLVKKNPGNPTDTIYTFTPNSDTSGTASFNISVTDAGQAPDDPTPITVNNSYSISVTAVNDAPTANASSGTTAEDIGFTLDLRTLVSDTETSTNNLTFTVGGATNGTVVLDGDGHTARFTPTSQYHGAASFAYSVRDTGDPAGGGQTTGPGAPITTGPRTVSLTVTAVNDSPEFQSASLATAENVALDINLGALVSDVETADGALTYAVTNVVGGTIVKKNPGNPTDTIYTFTPTANFNGTASFTLAVTDTGDAPDDATPITVSSSFNIVVAGINSGPVTTSPSASSPEDVVYTVDLRTLVNDEETTNKNDFTFTVGNAVNGSVVLRNSFFADFTPTNEYNGSASFTYTVRDTGDPPGNAPTTGPSAPITANGIVNLTITSVNDAPTAVADSYRVFRTDTATGPKSYNVVANDLQSPDTGENLIIESISVTSNTPGDGSPSTLPTFSISSDGKQIVLDNPSQWFGTVQVTYVLRDRPIGDSTGLTSQTTATFEIVNFLAGHISGTVWADTENYGTLDATTRTGTPERGLAGVEVYLTGTSIFSQTVTLQTTTDSHGNFSFNDSSLAGGGVIPGDYIVSLAPHGVEQHGAVKAYVDPSNTVGAVSLASDKSFRVVFGEDGLSDSQLNFGIQGGLLPTFASIQDRIALPGTAVNGLLIGLDITAATSDQQYWYNLIGQGWDGFTDIQLSVNANLTVATLVARDSGGALHSRTFQIGSANDYYHIRVQARDGNSAVVRIMGTAAEIFGLSANAPAQSSGAEGEPVMYENGEGAQYASAADQVHSEESWA